MNSFKKSVICFVLQCVLLDVFEASISSSSNGITLKLTTDQPAVKNAPIGFFANLLGTNDTSPTYVYTWKSKAAGIKQTIGNQTTECNIIVSVAKEGMYEMKVWVDSGQGVHAKSTIAFNITETIIGEIQVLQPGVRPRNPNFVATKTTATMNFALYDPYHFFNETIYYAWFINGGASGSSQSFNYSFIEAKNYDVMLIVTAVKKEMYFKSSVLNLKARDPIQMLNITGQTSISHGDLLDLEVACTGSMPYSYCWHFTQSEVNVTTEKCLDPTMTTSCDIIIIRYFQKAGNYKLVVVIDNDIDHKVTVYNVNVFASAPEPQLSPIIVPLVCICLALLIIVIGIMYFIQTRRNCSIEVADFDFQQSDVLEFQTFYERLRDSCKELCGCVQPQNDKNYTYRRIPAQIT